MKKLAPICLFTYNRLNETRLTVQSLQENFLAQESDLIIFSDGAKDESSKIEVNRLRDYLVSVNGFKSVSIRESGTNLGLARSIIQGVSKVVAEYGSVIVLEDDLISTPNFLTFMNKALIYYKNSNQIQSINGYSLKVNSIHDVYFQQRTFPWGWATWKNRWRVNLFDKQYIYQNIQSDKTLLPRFNKACGNDISSMLKGSICGRNDSWYVRWVLNHFINDNYAVYPNLSKITNIGFINEGTHCTGINTYNSKIDDTNSTNFNFRDFTKCKEIDTQFLRFFTKRYKLLFRLNLLKQKEGRNQLKKEIIRRLL